MLMQTLPRRMLPKWKPNCRKPRIELRAAPLDVLFQQQKEDILNSYRYCGETVAG